MSYSGFIQALLTRYYIHYLYICVKSAYVSLREDTRCQGRLRGRVRLAVCSLGRIEALLRRFGGAIKYIYTLLCVYQDAITLRRYYIYPLFRLYWGTNKALFRLYQGAVKALLALIHTCIYIYTMIHTYIHTHISEQAHSFRSSG